MNDTTVDKVRAIASNLGQLPDSTIQMYIDDAKLEMENLNYNPKYEEKIMRYLAAHFGTLDYPKAISERVEGIGSQSYADRSGKKDLELTEYGKEVLRLLKKSNGPNMVVIS